MADLYHICSTACVNQFEIRGTCIELLSNNVSLQGNNVKIKLNLKMENIFRDCCLNFFCEISDKAPKFCLDLSEAYS